jgi:hypothetical protein
MGKFSRDKGRRGETEMVNIFKAWGLKASRDGWKQVKDGDSTYSDVSITTTGYRKLRVEVKWQESIAMKFWRWLKGHDLLVVKRNGKIPLAVLPLTDYLELIGGIKPTEDS